MGTLAEAKDTATDGGGCGAVASGVPDPKRAR